MANETERELAYRKVDRECAALRGWSGVQAGYEDSSSPTHLYGYPPEELATYEGRHVESVPRYSADLGEALTFLVWFLESRGRATEGRDILAEVFTTEPDKYASAVCLWVMVAAKLSPADEGTVADLTADLLDGVARAAGEIPLDVETPVELPEVPVAGVIYRVALSFGGERSDGWMIRANPGQDWADLIQAAWRSAGWTHALGRATVSKSAGELGAVFSVSNGPLFSTVRCPGAVRMRPSEVERLRGELKALRLDMRGVPRLPGPGSTGSKVLARLRRLEEEIQRYREALATLGVSAFQDHAPGLCPLDEGDGDFYDPEAGCECPVDALKRWAAGVLAGGKAETWKWGPVADLFEALGIPFEASTASRPLTPGVLADALDIAERRGERVLARAESLEAVHGGEYWTWQGDGSDVPSSLTCHVVMSAEDLRGLVYETLADPKATGESIGWDDETEETMRARDAEVVAELGRVFEVLGLPSSPVSCEPVQLSPVEFLTDPRGWEALLYEVLCRRNEPTLRYSRRLSAWIAQSGTGDPRAFPGIRVGVGERIGDAVASLYLQEIEGEPEFVQEQKAKSESER